MADDDRHRDEPCADLDGSGENAKYRVFPNGRGQVGIGGSVYMRLGVGQGYIRLYQKGAAVVTAAP